MFPSSNEVLDNGGKENNMKVLAHLAPKITIKEADVSYEWPQPPNYVAYKIPRK